MKLENPHLDHFPSLVAMFFDRAERGGGLPSLPEGAGNLGQFLKAGQDRIAQDSFPFCPCG